MVEINLLFGTLITRLGIFQLIINQQKSIDSRSFINYFDTLPPHLLLEYFNTLDYQTQIEFKNTMAQKDQIKNELFIERFNEWALNERINASAPFDRGGCQGSDNNLSETMSHQDSLDLF